MTREELRAVMQGGKHHEVAKAWLASDDAVLQYRDHRGSWRDHPSLFSAPLCEYYDFRIKPKTLRYRVALLGLTTPYTNTADSTHQECGFAERSDFIRWLGDWQEVEV